MFWRLLRGVLDAFLGVLLLGILLSRPLQGSLTKVALILMFARLAALSRVESRERPRQDDVAPEVSPDKLRRYRGPRAYSFAKPRAMPSLACAETGDAP